MAEQEDTEFVAPHKIIKNTFTNGTVPTELLMNSRGRLQTPKRMKERRKKKRGIKKRDQKPWREAEGEQRSPH